MTPYFGFAMVLIASAMMYMVYKMKINRIEHSVMLRFTDNSF